MKIIAERLYQGANSYLPVPAVVLVLTAGDGDALPAPADLARAARKINEAIKPIDNPFTPARLKDLYEPETGLAAAGALIADLALVLHRQFGCTASGSTLRPLGEPGRLAIAYETRFPIFGRTAGHCALRLLLAALKDDGTASGVLAGLVEELKDNVTTQLPSYETRLLLQEADRRGIPWFRLAENIPVVELGQGALRQRFRSSLTERTGDTAYRIASFKPLAAHVMQQVGVPMPGQAIADTEDAAAAIAARLGYPVVVKPVGRDMGVGVRIGIASESELRAAYRDSRQHGTLQIESHLPGFDHRFTFIDGRLVSVLRTSPPVLRGDGSSTIGALLEAVPQTTATLVQKPIIVDDEVRERIAATGYGLDDVLPAGKRIQLRRWWRNKPDHVLENVTDLTHPENIDAALLAVETVGLDVAGVDYITTDISRPYHETGGAFTEVNPMPALAGVQRSGTRAYPLLLEVRFPAAATGRVPVAVMAGGSGAPEIADTVERLLTQAGHRAGIAADGRLAVSGALIRRKAGLEIERMRTILRHPRTTAALIQVSAASVVEHGLGLERCDVGIVLPRDAALDGATSSPAAIEAQGAAVLISAIDRFLVMRADDPLAAMAIAAMGERPIIWVAADAAGPADRRRHDIVVSAASVDGGRVATIDEGQAPRRLRLPPAGGASERGWPLLVAVATAFALGITLPEEIGPSCG
jgi:cyanophycin synthetase